jgi:hypothetical protein
MTTANTRRRRQTPHQIAKGLRVTARSLAALAVMSLVACVQLPPEVQRELHCTPGPDNPFGGQSACGHAPR